MWSTPAGRPAQLPGQHPLVRDQGAEADSDLLLDEHWSAHASATFIDAQYVSYVSGPCPWSVSARPPRSAICPADLCRARPNGPGRRRRVQAFCGDRRDPGEAYLHAEAAYRGNMYGDPTDSATPCCRATHRQRRPGLSRQQDLGSLRLAKNLLDQNYLQNVTVQAGNSARRRHPRRPGDLWRDSGRRGSDLLGTLHVVPELSVTPASASAAAQRGVFPVAVDQLAWSPASTILPPLSTRIWSASATSTGGGPPPGWCGRRAAAQGGLDRRFGTAVERAGGFVEDQEAWLRQQGPRQADPLALAARQLQPPLADLVSRPSGRLRIKARARPGRRRPRCPPRSPQAGRSQCDAQVSLNRATSCGTRATAWRSEACLVARRSRPSIETLPDCGSIQAQRQADQGGLAGATRRAAGLDGVSSAPRRNRPPPSSARPAPARPP